MSPTLRHNIFRQAITTHARAASLAALLPLVGAVSFTSPAKAASPPGCQAIDASGLLSSTTPSGACSQAINPGDTFSIDFSNLIADPATSGNFSVNNTYSLQVANIGSGTLDFENVQLEVIGNSPFGNLTTLTPIAVWTASGPTGPSGQGNTNYVTGTLGPGVGMLPPASNTASFSLTSPVAGWPPFGVPAGLINTFALKLSDAGITSFTAARITGKLKSSSSPGAFSAGLGIFTGSAAPPNQPTFIYGNAFNAVPGPLPILGAGAAFGWSRRLRKRVRKAAVVASVA